ncbi:MAG TPA: hypothetical protein VMM77_11225 [Gemmatimonadaceae bacterium]|nr:hypothetical protein [Gemmatimonadaceae bacterium]
MSHRRIALSMFALFTLVACSTGDDADPAADSVVAGPDSSSVEAFASMDAPTAMMVTLTGGPNAGTYTAASGSQTCSVGANGVDVWSSQFVDDTATSGLGSMQVMIPGEERARQGTGTFYFAMVLGNFMQGTDYVIETRPQTQNAGSGTARVVDTGESATITVEGVTRDSVQVRAEIRCRDVRRGR